MTDKKILTFNTGLKYSNIATNMPSLKVYAEDISSTLEHIKTKDEFSVYKDRCMSAMNSIIMHEHNPEVVINNYVQFGDTSLSLLNGVDLSEFKEQAKKIAIAYLEIAKQSKDNNIKTKAFSIADKISGK